MTILGGLGIIAGAVLTGMLLVSMFRLALSLWMRWAEVRRQTRGLDLEAEAQRLGVARQRLDLERARLEHDRQRLAVIEKVFPGVDGLYPLLWNGSRALDANRGVVFSIADGAEVVTPALAVPEQKARLLRAAGGWPPGSADKLLVEPAQATWPSRVPLSGLLDGTPSYRALVLGVTLANGRPEVVRGDMASMVHVAVGGSSGWGKSVFLRALAFQLAQSAEPVDLALVDLEGATFAPFSQCGRLLWPLADTEAGALAILSELTGELNRRRALFAEYPGIDSLATYNAQGGNGLNPVVCLIDEATALLSHSDVENALRTLALRARKYGLWLVMGGQDWKATSLDTAIRNQLATRVQFKALSASQSRVLLQQSGAENLDAKGRALAWLPGRELTELQAPWVSRGDILSAMTGDGPKHAMPTVATAAGNDAGRLDRVLELHYQGMKPTPIAREVWGYANSRTVAEVQRIVEMYADNDDNDTLPEMDANDWVE